MDQVRLQTPPRWWAPLLSPTWVHLLRPFRRGMQRKQQRLLDVEVRGLDHLQGPLGEGHGTLVTPNHSAHADAYVMYEAADQVGSPFFFMVAWQVLGQARFFRRIALRKHGCFSVDREGTDLRAFKQAVEILQSRSAPLVIFPEGEVYHINERVTPFREGPATIALSAAKRADRPVVCVPCGIRYHYLEDPTPGLHRLMDELEQAMFWRPTPDRPLADRIYRLAEAALALKELEYLGCTSSGTIPDRIAALSDVILNRIEERLGVECRDATIPERVKTLRQRVIQQLETAADQSPEQAQCRNDLDDLYLVVQLFSYPGDYVAERPSLERMAETLDKFEEDVLGRQTATIRGTRRAVVTFGEPIPVEPSQRRREAAADLTHTLERRVQALLDDTIPAA